MRKDNIYKLKEKIEEEISGLPTSEVSIHTDRLLELIDAILEDDFDPNIGKTEESEIL
jgi:hypothetical protein